MSLTSPPVKTAYHIESGRFEFPYSVDAHSAVSRHPKEWSFEPWGEKVDKRAAVEIPTDWRDLPTAQRRRLAMRLGAPQTVKAVEADALLEEEESRRENTDPEARSTDTDED